MSATLTVPDPEIDEDAPRFCDPDLFFLYGKDPTPGIVGMTPLFESDATYMEVYVRENGTVNSERHRFYPFFYLDDMSHLEAYGQENFKWKRVSGDNRYSNLLVFDSWGDYTDALNWLYRMLGYPAPELDEHGEPDYDHRKIEEVHIPGNLQTMFQMQTGMTYFGGMTLEDTHRMQLDIEVYSSTEQFPDPEREEDEIIIITLSDNRGGKWILTQDNKNGVRHNDLERETGAEVRILPDEESLIYEAQQVIGKEDPDVIEGHNVLDFDLRYILDRCEMHGLSFRIGRDGQAPYTWESSRTFAERDVDYLMVSVNGRAVIDTMFLVMDYDVFAREMESHGLKYSAKHFGVAAGGDGEEERTYIKGDEIANFWDNDPYPLLKYALDDVLETEGLAEILSESAFYMTQILPFSYQDAERKGTATQIEALFTREYLRQKVSIPEPDTDSQSSGGYTDLYQRGVFERIVYADVSSLYPSIMREYRCEPGEKDPINIFQRTLEQLLDMRLEVKTEMRGLKDEVKEDKEKLGEWENKDMPPPEGVPTEKDIQKKKDRIDLLDAKQSSYKILINSFYGSLGFQLFAWNNIPEADRVAEVGQELLKSMIADIEDDGGEIIEVDTDGVIFTPSEEMDIPRDEEAEAQYVRDLTERQPEGIKIDHDGSFEKMISYKRKNYALKKYGQDPSDMKVKGSSLISRSSEPFGREFVDRVLQALITEDVKRIHEIYLEYYEKIMRSDWGVEEFSRTESLKETFEEYHENVADFEENGVGHGHTRYARYEVALRDQKAGHAEYGIGDSVSYYVANRPYDSVADRAKHVRNYEGDEDTEYYIDRLNTFAEKFAEEEDLDGFFGEFAFRRVFSPDDALFAFDPSGIEIQKTRARPPLTESETIEVPDKPERSLS